MLTLPAELTHTQARVCLQALLQRLRTETATRTVVVDASALTVFDSSALAVLLECRRTSQAQGQSFAIKGLDARLQGLCELYGVDALLPVAVPDGGA